MRGRHWPEPPGTGRSVSRVIPRAVLLILIAVLLAAWQQGLARVAAAAAAASAAQGNVAANWALRQIGKPYRWAAAGPGAFDCSGLTMRAWQRAGVRLGHFTGWQWTSGPHVPLNRLRRGDLVFFATNTAKPSTIHHVGVYIGRGKMVDAPHTGARVRIETIYEPGLIGATRPA